MGSFELNCPLYPLHCCCNCGYGERMLQDCGFGVWAKSLLVAGEASSYNDFAAIMTDACLLLHPAPQSLAAGPLVAQQVGGIGPCL